MSGKLLTSQRQALKRLHTFLGFFLCRLSFTVNDLNSADDYRDLGSKGDSTKAVIWSVTHNVQQNPGLKLYMDEEGTSAHLVLPEGVDLRAVDVVYEQTQKCDDQVLGQSRDKRVPPSRADGRGAISG